eukprot:302834_1
MGDYNAGKVIFLTGDMINGNYDTIASGKPSEENNLGKKNKRYIKLEFADVRNGFVGVTELFIKGSGGDKSLPDEIDQDAKAELEISNNNIRDDIKCVKTSPTYAGYPINNIYVSDENYWSSESATDVYLIFDTKNAKIKKWMMKMPSGYGAGKVTFLTSDYKNTGYEEIGFGKPSDINDLGEQNKRYIKLVFTEVYNGYVGVCEVFINGSGGDKSLPDEVDEVHANVSTATCKNNHELKFMATGYGGAYGCDICGKTKNDTYAYRCSSCGYDLCKSCYVKEGGVVDSGSNSDGVTCAKDHLLKWMKTGYSGGSFYCDICRKGVKSEFAHHCATCGYDLCESCYDERNGNNNDYEVKTDSNSNVICCDNRHELLLVSHNELISYHGFIYAVAYSCNICEADYSNVDAWHCKICKYDMCLSCYEREHGRRNMDNESDINIDEINTDKLLEVAIRCEQDHACKFASKDEMLQVNAGYAGGYGCNVCKQGYAWSTAKGAWQCSICGYDVCRNDFLLAQCQSDNINDKFAFKLIYCIKYNEYYKLSDVLNVITHKSNKNKLNVNYIINKYNDKKMSNSLNVFTYTAYQVAVNVMKLIYAKVGNIVDLNCVSSNGTTPIIQAAENESAEMVKFLLKNGASANSINKYNETAMWHGISKGNIEIIKLLIKYGFDWDKYINAPSKVPGGGNFTGFHMCCLNGSIRCLEYLFSIEKNYSTKIDVHSKAVKNQTGLLLACNSNSTSVVEFLFTKTKFLDKPNIINEKNTGEHNAALHLSARWGNVSILKLLKENGANMALEGENNLNAILIASSLSKPAAVQYLIDSNSINPNYQDRQSLTALNVCLDNENAFNTCKILCSYDHIKILEHKRQGYDVLDLACMKGRVKCFQLLMTTLIKRNNITNWKQFLDSKILTSKKTQSLILGAKMTEQVAMKHFLENLTKNALANENFDLVVAMCDFDGGTAAKQKIEVGEAVLSKNETIANILLKYLSSTNDKETIKKLNDVINRMIENKEPINDMLLFFANNTNQVELMKSLKQSICDSLNGTSTRNYSWYKYCLLSSHIWSVKQEDEKCNLLFDEMKTQVIDVELCKQQNFLSLQMLNEVKTEGEEWNKVIRFPELNIAASGIMNQHFLQDSMTGLQYMSKGCQVKYKQNELFKDLITGFDGNHEYDLDQYLNDLVITAHKINGEFQRQCRKLFTKQSLGVDCVFKPAPVKTKQRSQIKATVDYYDKPWPTTSSILDFVRCGISFRTAKDMIMGLIKAKSLIDVSKSGGCIKRVCRIKNMFKSVPQWGNDIEKYSYCDIKFNVVIEFKDIAMIGEIQFLLDWMQEAKVLGHSLYGFVRNEEYVKELSIEWYENMTENDRMSELLNIVAIKNYKRLEKQLLYGDLKQIFNIKFMQNGKENTLEDLLVQNRWKKGLKLYKATLKRFNKLIQNM